MKLTALFESPDLKRKAMEIIESVIRKNSRVPAVIEIDSTQQRSGKFWVSVVTAFTGSGSSIGRLADDDADPAMKARITKAEESGKIKREQAVKRVLFEMVKALAAQSDIKFVGIEKGLHWLAPEDIVEENLKTIGVTRFIFDLQ